MIAFPAGVTKPNHPWSDEDQEKIRRIVSPRSSQVERMNRTVKDATVKRYHYENHDQLRTHFGDIMAAYNYAPKLKTLGGLTPYEYICKIWTSEPDRFTLNPIHQMPGLNTIEQSRRRPIPRHDARRQMQAAAWAHHAGAVEASPVPTGRVSGIRKGGHDGD